jgi:hypothetical protein
MIVNVCGAKFRSGLLWQLREFPTLVEILSPNDPTLTLPFETEFEG